MENITIGQIKEFVLFLGSFIAGISVLLFYLKKGLKSLLKEELKPIKDSLYKVDENSTKNYLSKCFNDLRQGQILSEANKKRIYEQMDHYTKPKEEGGLGCNSYIHKEFEDLKKEGLL